MNYKSIKIPPFPNRRIRQIEIVPLVIAGFIKDGYCTISHTTKRLEQINHVEYRGIDCKNFITESENGNPFDGEIMSYCHYFDKELYWDMFLRKELGTKIDEFNILFTKKDYERCNICKLEPFTPYVKFGTYD